MNRCPCIIGVDIYTGAVIQAGNWGRIVIGWGPRHNAYLREYAFEQIRRQEFPDLPSRIESVFVFEDPAFAMAWTRVNPPEPEHVYRVEPIEARTRTVRVDMTWVDTFSQYHSFDSIDECIRRHWRANASQQPKWEVLIAGPVTVCERVSPIPDDQLVGTP
jgi:hypothetical protein